MFSVLIPVFNHARYVEQAVLSALTSHLVAEVLLVDDGSSDDSVKVITRIAKAHPERVRLIENNDKQNVGAPARLNQLVRAASSKWLAVLNSDDLFAPGRFETIASLLESSNTDFVFGSLAIIDSNGTVTRNKRAFLLPEYAIPEELSGLPSSKDDLFALLLNQNYIATTSNMVFSKALYETVGKFSDYRYCHDWDFALRALLLGNVKYVPQILTSYRLHDTNTISDSWRVVHEEVRQMLGRFLADFPGLKDQKQFQIALDGNQYLLSQASANPTTDTADRAQAESSNSNKTPNQQLLQLQEALSLSQTDNQRLQHELHLSGLNLQSAQKQNALLEDRQKALVSRLHKLILAEQRAGSTRPAVSNIVSSLVGGLRRQFKDSPDQKQNLSSLDNLTDREKIAFALLQSSSFFDPEYYCTTYPDASDCDDALIHYITVGAAQDRNPNCWFDLAFYRRNYRDLLGSGLDLLSHFIEHGASEGRRANEAWDFACDGLPLNFPLPTQVHAFSGGGEEPQSYIASFGYSQPTLFLARLSQLSSDCRSPLLEYLMRDFTDKHALAALDHMHPRTQPSKPGANKQIVIFLGHEGSRTGAPMVLLNLVQQFAESGFECITVLKSGGPLVPEFAQYSHVLELSGCADMQAAVRTYMSSIFTAEQPYTFVGTIANSLESFVLAEPLAEFKAPIIFLVHELSHGYAQDWLQNVADISETIVFSSEFTRNSFLQKTKLRTEKTLVMPQGLLDPEFGTGCRTTARLNLREELELPESAFIVLACGNYHLRKGMDWFVETAKKSLEQCDSKENLHFVWIGHGEDHPFSLYYYCQWDASQHKIQDNVHFIGERSDLNDYFLGADIFLMISRQDPFPCVAQNAMAAGLPVLAFDGTGGVPEMLGAGGGNILPYGDLDAIAETVVNYYGDRELLFKTGDTGRQVINRYYRFDRYAAELREMILQSASPVDCKSQTGA